MDRDFLKTFKYFNEDLVTSLPMKDAVFFAKLNSKDLFSGDLKAKVKAKDTAPEAAAHFLDDKIEKDLRLGKNYSFLLLLSAMEEYDDKSLNQLATQINRQLKLENVSG